MGVFENHIQRRIFIPKRVKCQEGRKDCVMRNFIILFLGKSSCRIILK